MLWSRTVRSIVLFFGLWGLTLAPSCGGSNRAPLAPVCSFHQVIIPVGSPVSMTVWIQANGPITSASLASGTLPPGLTLGPDGTISGTPTAPGLYQSTLTLSNQAGGSTSIPCSIQVDPAQALALAYATPMTFIAGAPLPAQLPILDFATPGIPASYAMGSGSLPDGLSLDATSGAITGTPTTTGPFVFEVRVTNGTRTATASLTYGVISRGSPVLTYPTPVAFSQGAPIPTQTPTLGNVDAAFGTSFTLSDGTLPPGLTLKANGTFSGIPTAPGTYPFTVTMTNGPRTVATSASYRILSPAPGAYPVLNTGVNTRLTLFPTLKAGRATSAQLVDGSLPPGVSLDPHLGILMGAPTSAQVFVSTISLDTPQGNALLTPLVINVNSAGLVPLEATYQDATGTTGTAISPIAPTQASGNPIASARVVAGSLPPGLALDPTTGTVSGLPTMAGNFPILVTLQDAAGFQTTLPITLTVSPAGSTSLLATYPPSITGTLSAPILATPTVAAGGPVTAATLTEGALPTGIDLDPVTGVLSGIAQSNGVFPVHILLQNASGNCQALVTTLNVAKETGGEVPVASYGTGTGTVWVPITPILPRIESGGPIVLAQVATGSLPNGLDLDPETGAISGTPVQSGLYNAMILLMNTDGTPTLVPLVITIAPAAPPAGAQKAQHPRPFDQN
jgi:hypothetical protein